MTTELAYGFVISSSDRKRPRPVRGMTLREARAVPQFGRLTRLPEKIASLKKAAPDRELECAKPASRSESDRGDCADCTWRSEVRVVPSSARDGCQRLVLGIEPLRPPLALQAFLFLLLVDIGHNAEANADIFLALDHLFIRFLIINHRFFGMCLPP